MANDTKNRNVALTGPHVKGQSDCLRFTRRKGKDLLQDALEGYGESSTEVRHLV